MKLTKRRRDILEWINAFRAKHGEYPTLQQIADHFGMRWRTGAREQVKKLIDMGLIDRDRYRHRGLKEPEPSPFRPFKVSRMVGRKAEDELLDALRRHRESIAMSQTEVAKAMRCSVSAVSCLEQRKTKHPTLGHVQKYAEAMGMEVSIELQPRKGV
jgi:SOS-response transcriptional repressor LexA